MKRYRENKGELSVVVVAMLVHDGMELHRQMEIEKEDGRQRDRGWGVIIPIVFFIWLSFFLLFSIKGYSRMNEKKIDIERKTNMNRYN